MDSVGDYRIRIEMREAGAPKYRVVVTYGERTVGEDYSCSPGQAEELGHRMIQRHRQLVTEPKRLVFG